MSSTVPIHTLTQPSNRDRWARGILESVWTGLPKTLEAVQAVQAIARHESSYGYPAADPAWEGSHNWGAIQEPLPTAENSFEHLDHDAHGNPYIGHFRKYLTDEEGAQALVRELARRPAVVRVIGSGSASAIANAMHTTGYFEASPTSYAQAIRRNARAIAQAIGEPLRVNGAVRDRNNALGLLALAILGYTAWKE